MATIGHAFTHKPISYALMGTTGTAGDLMVLKTGSAMTLVGSADHGTCVTDSFIGILEDTTTKGSYAAIQSGGMATLEKHTSTEKIELGDIIYGTHNKNTVGTLAGGTAIGVCAKQSATDNTYVQVEMLPFWITGANGFQA